MTNKPEPASPSAPRPKASLRKWVLPAIVVVTLGGLALNEARGGDDRDLSNTLGDNQVRVSRDTFDGWPLTIEGGILECNGADGVGKVVLNTDDGGVYAVNGLAKADAINADIDPIWADDPTSPGLKLPMKPLIDRGLELCD